VRVCDWIPQYLRSQGVERVHGLMGGGASGLNDGFIKAGMPYICYHHEQGAGHAAIGETKFTGKVSVVNPTTGCAGTNCATSVLNAWQDSVPVIFISGNVRLDACSGYINEQRGIQLRKYGVQEHHIVDTYATMTKWSVFVTDVRDVAYTLERAMWLAQEGTPGPVWIDIPSDIQNAPMPEDVKHFEPPASAKLPVDFEFVKKSIEMSERPLILAGYGIRQSQTVDLFNEFIERYEIPFASTYGARDYTPGNHHYSMGTVGIKGSRAGNFAVQNCDLLLILGCSLGSSVVGYDPKQFSPYSYKIMIDIDNNELNKDIVSIDARYLCGLEKFFGAML